MHRCLRVIARVGLGVVMTWQAAFAQPLNLAPRPKPPAAGVLTAADELIGVMEREAAALIDAEKSMDGRRALVTRASIQIRLIAIELLTASNRAGEQGAIAAMHGLRLARGREVLDLALRKLLTPDESLAPEQVERAARSIRSFNELAAQRVRELRILDSRELDAALASLAGVLAEAIEILEGESIRTHWPGHDEVNSPDSARAPGGSEPEPPQTDSLREAAAAAGGLSDVARDAIGTLLELADRAAPFPEHRVTVNEIRNAIAKALAMHNAIAAALWMNDDQREHYVERIAEGIALLSDPATRQRGLRRLDRIDASCETIEKLNSLAALQVEIAPLVDAVRAADEMRSPDQERASGAQLQRLTVIVDRMRAFRELEPHRPAREEARRAMTLLERSYLDAEKALLMHVDRIATDPAAMGDPAIGTLLADQAQYLEDLSRVRATDSWIELIRLIRPESVGGFANQVRRMTQWLIDPNRRPDAVQAMRQFEQQAALFYPLPFEAELTRNSPEAAALTGGLAARLLQRIAEERAAWAKAWGNGITGSDAANRLLLLHRLMLTMRDAAALVAGEQEFVLDRWAAWPLGPEVWTESRDMMINRLKLASISAIEGREAELRQLLERIEQDMPVTLLAARLSGPLRPALAELPGGAAGLIGQMMFPPREDAWLAHRRADLAWICRYAVEMKHARMNGRTETANELAMFIHAVSQEILAELGAVRDPMPRLLGFD